MKTAYVFNLDDVEKNWEFIYRFPAIYLRLPQIVKQGETIEKCLTSLVENIRRAKSAKYGYQKQYIAEYTRGTEAMKEMNKPDSRGTNKELAEKLGVTAKQVSKMRKAGTLDAALAELEN